MRRARVSDAGIVLQFAAVALCFAFRAVQARIAPAAIAAALLLYGASLAVTQLATNHLGRQWRLRAVVTDDHELVTTGPYRFVRHPIYTAFLGMLVATALLITAPWAAGLAIVLFLAGTEIRVHAEDSLLAAHFPEAFAAYRRGVPAYLPRIR